MEQQPITCEMVDQRELDRLYVAGRLGEDEAAAFEAHYFGCDRCWALVKGGAGVRAALAGTAAQAPAIRRRSWVRPLATAAALAIVVFGTWRLVDPTESDAPDAIRGPADSIAVATGSAAGRWTAAWPSVAEPGSYQVRLFTADGRLILTRDMSDTTLSLPADSLTGVAGGGTLFLEVQRLDMLRRPVARSPLIALRPPGQR